jgi:hypothetical protein
MRQGSARYFFENFLSVGEFVSIELYWLVDMKNACVFSGTSSEFQGGSTHLASFGGVQCNWLASLNTHRFALFEREIAVQGGHSMAGKWAGNHDAKRYANTHRLALFNYQGVAKKRTPEEVAAAERRAAAHREASNRGLVCHGSIRTWRAPAETSRMTF